MRTRLILGALALTILLPSLAVLGTEAGGASPKVSTINLVQPQAYTPKAINGGTDDYHCTLVNPHVTKSSFITASQFFPGSKEDHHAILFLVPPSLAAAAEAANKGGNGWTCFGESPIPGTGLAQITNTPWLSAWAPGHGKDVQVAGTGTPLPAGSLVVMQVHYNLLQGDKPVRNSLRLWTVPASTNLQPVTLNLYPAPPDVPCATGVSGPLCDRTAALSDLSSRFGTEAVGFVNAIEAICGRNPANPPAGNTTSCDWGSRSGGYVVRVGAHMHLTGRALKITLNPGTPQAKVLVDVKNYNFDYQRSYNVSPPVKVSAGDKVQVKCTYDPKFRSELPQLRKLPARFVTWGDGSSDEMCLGLVMTVPKLP